MSISLSTGDIRQAVPNTVNQKVGRKNSMSATEKVASQAMTQLHAVVVHTQTMLNKASPRDRLIQQGTLLASTLREFNQAFSKLNTKEIKSFRPTQNLTPLLMTITQLRETLVKKTGKENSRLNTELMKARMIITGSPLMHIIHNGGQKGKLRHNQIRNIIEIINPKNYKPAKEKKGISQDIFKQSITLRKNAGINASKKITRDISKAAMMEEKIKAWHTLLFNIKHGEQPSSDEKRKIIQLLKSAETEFQGYFERRMADVREEYEATHKEKINKQAETLVDRIKNNVSTFEKSDGYIPGRMRLEIPTPRDYTNVLCAADIFKDPEKSAHYKSLGNLAGKALKTLNEIKCLLDPPVVNQKTGKTDEQTVMHNMKTIIENNINTYEVPGLDGSELAKVRINLKSAVDSSFWIIDAITEKMGQGDYFARNWFITDITSIQGSTNRYTLCIYMLLFKKMAPILANNDLKDEEKIILMKKVFMNYIKSTPKLMNAHMQFPRFNWKHCARILLDKYANSPEVQAHVQQEVKNAAADSFLFTPKNSMIFNETPNAPVILGHLNYTPTRKDISK